jgi:uncharacterized protein (DUF952 family)
MSIILHITKQAKWEQALKTGRYETDSLGVKGLIHCSKPDQVISVANSLFRGQTDLVLLCIDTDKTASEIRYENCKGGNKLFPHIYGSLNLDAVTHICDFQPLSNGKFTLPEKLADNTS